MDLLIFVFSLLILGFLLYVIYLLSYSLLFGAPYAALGSERTKTVFKLLNIKKGEKFIDLGSGDGRLVAEAAHRGAIAFGYEINPLISLISQLRTRDTKNVTIKTKDFWRADLSQFDCIAIYGNFHIMGRLEKKLQKELKPGAKVVSNHFKFPNLKPAKVEKDVYLYIKTDLHK